jgi:LmbE family N-acetylglucosaminyl deacetylase
METRSDPPEKTMDYKRVIVFGAHPDDELRMAPAMAKMAAAGATVTPVILTNGCEGFPSEEMRDTIVETRARESVAAAQVLGTEPYINVGSPDMGLVNDKATLKKLIGIIRRLRPQAIFTHGEKERHRDHIATHDLTLEASWHAGEPVCADLGAPWRTPHLYYYKNTAMDGPVVQYDVTDFAHITPAVYATQESQHVLFKSSREKYLQDAERARQNPPRTVLRFIIHPWTVLRDFPALDAE